MKKFGIIALLLGLSWNCNRGEYECVNCAIQYAASDPTQLTPFNASDPTAAIIFNHLFQTLLSFDYQTNEIIPVLAKERPTIRTIEQGKLEATFEIHEAATWDDGKPITADDVAFSIKVIKCPETDNHQLKPDFEIIEKVVIDKKNPKRFSLIYAKPTMLWESILTDLLIIPKQTYDPTGILDIYDVYELTYRKEVLLQDANLKKFAESYNSPKFQNEIINGSGPYRLDSWVSNERIILKLKERWWGFALRNFNQWFEANQKELVFEIFNNPYTGYQKLKQGKIHIMNDVPIEMFARNWFPENSDYRKDYYVFTAPTFSYDYIGINEKSKKLTDQRVRQALAHLMDIDKLIEKACFGFADKVTSFTHPSLKDLINPNIQPYTFSLALADSLLTDAGWLDLDSNGIREKIFTTDSIPEIKELNLIINYNTGNARRKMTCELLKKAAEAVGIKITIKPLELVNLLENLKNHDFELYIGGWVASPKLADPKTIWHTESANGGSNYVFFGNDRSDAIVDAIHKELNPKKRAALYRSLHQLIHEDIPYIFLISQQQRIVVDKKFKNVYGCGMIPGVWVPGFQ